MGVKDPLTDGSTDLLSRQFRKLDPFLSKKTPWKKINFFHEQFVFTSPLHKQTTNLYEVSSYHLHICIPHSFALYSASHHWEIAVKITAACVRIEIKPVRETPSMNHRFKKS